MSKMAKILLWLVGGFVGLALLFFFVLAPILKNSTKKHSPEQTVTYNQGDLQIDLFYCSPSKKDRVIFGELIPYGEVWRTGANEASTFTTNKDLWIDGQTLAAGTYSLWTIPDREQWQVIFNSKMYPWGVNFTDQKPQREAEFDAVVATATVSESISVQEEFSINVIDSDPEGVMILLFAWDNVVVPLNMELK